MRVSLAAAAAALPPGPSSSDEVHVGVASNFVSVAEDLARNFETATAHQISVVTGSTGKLYAQILNGAPFAVFMSADEFRPRLLEEAGKTIPGSRFTYAFGSLALWSRRSFPEGSSLAGILTHASVRRIAIPNPELAPFGKAALETLSRLDIADQVAEKLVYAENVGQAFTFAATGNADAGFVSMSNLVGQTADGHGFLVPVPASLHAPIRQDAVALLRADGNEAALAFMDFLKSGEALSVISGYGYRLGPDD